MAKKPAAPTRNKIELWMRDNPTGLAFAQMWRKMRSEGTTDWHTQRVVDYLVDAGMPRVTRWTFEQWTTNYALVGRKVKVGKSAIQTAQTILTAPRDDAEVLAEDRAKVKAREKQREAKGVIRALEREIDEYQLRLDFLDDLAAAPDPKPYEVRAFDKQGRTLPAAAYVMLASDWHVGENVRPETINGLNEYNPDIAQERAERFWRSNLTMLNAARSAWDIRQGVLWLGGDLITGYIHEEYEEANYLSPTEESLLVYEMMVSGIDYFLAASDLDHLLIPTSHGNHGRTNKKPRIGTQAKNSYEWMVYQLLARRYKDEPRVTFQIANGYNNIVDLYGFNIRFHHGDAVKYGGGVGGLSVPMQRRIGRQAIGDRVKIDLDVIGHFHDLQCPKNLVVNGSLIGWNSYAEQIGCGFQEPLQGSFVIDDRHKFMSNFNPIVVTKRKKRCTS